MLQFPLPKVSPAPYWVKEALYPPPEDEPLPLPLPPEPAVGEDFAVVAGVGLLPPSNCQNLSCRSGCRLPHTVATWHALRVVGVRNLALVAAHTSSRALEACTAALGVGSRLGDSCRSRRRQKENRSVHVGDGMEGLSKT